jgi:hypothetical protein
MYTKSYVLLHIRSLVTDVHLHKEFYEHFYVFSVYTHTLLLRVHHAKEYIYTVQSFSSPTKVFLKYWHECLLKYTLYIYIHVHILNLLHFCTNLLKYTESFKSLTGLNCYRCLIWFSCNYLKFFDALMTVVWTNETGNHFNIIVVWDWCCLFHYSLYTTGLNCLRIA